MLSRFLTKIVEIVAVIIAFAQVGNSQVLETTALNLNPGGVIYDVADDPYHNCYIIVGDFSTINGVNRKNVAFINKSDFSLNTSSFLNTITAIDGEVRTVEIYESETASYWNRRIYLGGNFTSITTTSGTYTRKGFAELMTSESKFLPITISNLNVTTWNINMDFAGNGIGVNDIYRSNDTLILVGNFQFFSSGQPYALLYNVVSFKAASHAWIPIFNNSGGTGSAGYDLDFCFIYSITRHGSKYYLSGEKSYPVPDHGFIYRYNLSGVFEPVFAPPFCGTNGSIWKSTVTVSGSDNFIVSTGKYSAANTTYVHDLNGNILDGFGCGVINILPDADGFARYKNSIFTRTQSQLNYYKMNGVYPVPSSYTINTNATTYSSSTGAFGLDHVSNGHAYRRTHICENFLFVSGNTLTSVNGTPRTGLAIYCLEPEDAKFFTTSDSTICPEDVMTYAIPPVLFADGYKWEYSGNGCDLQANGNVNIVPLELDGAANYSIQIVFTGAFTPGQLKVTPYSICNGGIKLYSNTIVTTILSNPLPHIDAGNDTTLTCAIDSVLLFGFSNDPVVSYEWLNALPPHNIGQDSTVTQPGFYIFKVKDALGCPNFDTVFVDLDDAKPIALPPTGTYDLTCAQPSKNFLGSTPSNNTSSQWLDVANGTYHSNPITISAPGNYTYIVTDTLNGCPKDTSIAVVLNQTQANINIQNYASINTIPFENLTCDNDSFLLVSYSSTSNSVAEWTNSDATVFYGDTIIIASPGNYYLQSTNNANGCTNTATINIAANQNLPNSNVPSTQLLNCSVDSIFLDGNSLVAETKLVWNGPSLVDANDPVIIYNPGFYYLTVTDTINGCTVVDSVLVNQDASINVFAGNDTLVCNQALVNLTANYVGTITGVNYLWNTGSTNNSELFTAGTSNFGIVEIFGDNGCYGIDTVYFNLPPIPVINFTGFKPCDDGASGSIVADPVSGMAPFLYSIDNGNNYQSAATFNGLTIGTYPIWVKDSLLCDYSFSATIDENSALPSPSFLFSTYNFASDTVVIIDVSNPPTDSTNWIFPSGITVLDNNPISPTILLPDTGTFVITMQAYYGNCLVELNKTIYASPFDSAAANQYNQNGIKSITLYPNPTIGSFVVEVEFYKSQSSAFVIQDMIGYTYENQQFEESTSFSAPVSLNLSAENGTYVLKLVSEFDSASLTFILTR